MKRQAAGGIRSNKALIKTIAIFALVAVCVILLLNRTEASVTQEQLSLLRNALYSAAISCYASEGCYPESLAYLKENYGIHYDDMLYSVSYDIFASNIMPDIDVRAKEVAK